MDKSTIEISKKDEALLLELAQETGKSIEILVSQAIGRMSREMLIEATNEAYARLRKDPVAWGELQSERALWDSTLMDGLEDY